MTTTTSAGGASGTDDGRGGFSIMYIFVFLACLVGVFLQNSQSMFCNLVFACLNSVV